MERKSVVLAETEYLVSDFQKKRGLKSFSKALRYIVTDYFKIRRQIEQELEHTDKRISEWIADNGHDQAAMIENFDNINDTLKELKLMMLMIGSGVSSKNFAEQFNKYFHRVS